MRKILLSLASLLVAGTAMAQVNFTFNRTSDSAATVNVAQDGETTTGIIATIAISGATTYQTADKATADVLSIDRNTANATNAEPNKYTLTITNNTGKAITFDQIKVSNVGLTSGGGWQGNTVSRQRYFVIKYGNNTTEPQLKYINDDGHNNGTAVNNLFDVETTQTIESGKNYEVSVSIYTDGGEGCYYGLTEISLINTYELEVTDAGYATMMLGYNATIPTDVTCYKVSGVASDYATLTAIEGTLAANTPVVVEAAVATYTFEPTPDATAVADNKLAGSLSAKDVASVAGKTFYVLAKDNGNAAFCKVNMTDDKFTCKANKAYLPVEDGGAGARSLFFNFGGETAIESIQGTENADAVVYDLAGRRVNSAQKGLYIVNGKVVIK